MTKLDTLENQAKMVYIGIGSNLGNKIINIEKAAEWYYDALISGNITAKKDLDSIYDKTVEFKKAHKNYLKS